MYKAPWMRAVLLAASVALIAACGGDDDDEPSGSADAASTTTAAADGGGANGGGGASVDLGDFAVPLPGWAEAVTPDLSGPLDVVLFTVPLDQVDATVAFYEEWAGSQTETFTRTDGAGGGVTLQSDVAAGEEKTVISILSPLGGDDFVQVSLSRGVFE